MLTKPYAIVACALLCAGAASVMNVAAQSGGGASPSLVVRGLPDFTELVEQVGPSVVNIRTSEKIKVRAPWGGGASGDDDAQPFAGMDPNMLELLRRFGMPIPQMPKAPQGAQKQPPAAPQEVDRPRGVGSGFILSADGFILTNAHVIDGATDVLVMLTDKREFKAKIIGADKRTDVAVVKIEATGLPAVKLGDVQRLKVGEWVMAIGSPFGLDNSVTAGIVSAKARDTGEYLPFIQTDVAINPGNSGGPLINMRGEVVGINSQIVTRSGGYNGVSLSIPIDEAIRVADQLRAGGRVARGRIGVEAGSVSADLAQSLGLTQAKGALVARVLDDSPAAAAGIEPGDIVLRFDGKPIEKASDLPRAVGSTKPGTKTTMSVFRRGKMLDISLVVAELEPDDAKRAQVGSSDAPAKPSSSPYAAAAQLGLMLIDVSEANKKEFKLKGGAQVESVFGRAAAAGVRQGDIITAIANQPVLNPKEAEVVLSQQDKAKSIVLQIRRGPRGDFILIKPESAAK